MLMNVRQQPPPSYPASHRIWRNSFHEIRVATRSNGTGARQIGRDRAQSNGRQNREDPGSPFRDFCSDPSGYLRTQGALGAAGYR